LSGRHHIPRELEHLSKSNTLRRLIHEQEGCMKHPWKKNCPAQLVAGGTNWHGRQYAQETRTFQDRSTGTFFSMGGKRVFSRQGSYCVPTCFPKFQSRAKWTAVDLLFYLSSLKKRITIFVPSMVHRSIPPPFLGTYRGNAKVCGMGPVCPFPKLSRVTPVTRVFVVYLGV